MAKKTAVQTRTMLTPDGQEKKYDKYMPAIPENIAILTDNNMLKNNLRLI